MYDSDGVVEYLGLGDDEIVDLETVNKRLWEEINQALNIVRLVESYSVQCSDYNYTGILQYRQP